MVSVLAKCRPLYRLRYLPIVGRYVDHHSADISVDTSVDTLTDTSRSTYRPTLDRYVDRHIGRHSAYRLIHWSSVGRYVDRDVNRYIGRGVHKIHMIHKYLWLIEKENVLNAWSWNLPLTSKVMSFRESP